MSLLCCGFQYEVSFIGPCLLVLQLLMLFGKVVESVKRRDLLEEEVHHRPKGAWNLGLHLPAPLYVFCLLPDCRCNVPGQADAPGTHHDRLYPLWKCQRKTNQFSLKSLLSGHFITATETKIGHPRLIT